MPDAKLDFAIVKLTIDKLVDPHIDVAAARREIDGMVATVKTMAGPTASPIERLKAVRIFIYVAGPWNGNRPFQYDLADPLGTNLGNKLLPSYLATRRGNCVSMPILFLILADRLGVHVTLSTAPLHVFVKYIDDKTGKAYNLETTSGGYPARDVWYRQKSPMTDDAIRNGLYLKTLSRREAVVVMASLLIEADMHKRLYREAIALADILLETYPNDVDAILQKGSAYAGLIDTEFRAKYPRPLDIPPRLLPVYRSYVAQNEVLFDRAVALGWRDTEHGMAERP